MTLGKLLSMWSHDYTKFYNNTCVSVYTERNKVKYFIMKFDHHAGPQELKEGFLNRKVAGFSVTETELKVVIDIYKKGVDHEFISPKEFYSLIDKDCIDLSDSDSKEWLDEMMEDTEESIKYFEWNPYHDSLLVTYVNIPHCMPGWEVKKYDN